MSDRTSRDVSVFEVTHQTAPRKRRQTLLVTHDRGEAEVALRKARRGLLVRWRNGKRVEVKEGAMSERRHSWEKGTAGRVLYINGVNRCIDCGLMRSDGAEGQLQWKYLGLEWQDAERGKLPRCR